MKGVQNTNVPLLNVKLRSEKSAKHRESRENIARPEAPLCLFPNTTPCPPQRLWRGGNLMAHLPWTQTTQCVSLLWFPSILLLCNKLIQTLTDTDVRSIKKGCTEHYSLEGEEATNCPVGGRWVGIEGFTGDVWAESYRMRHFLWIRLNLSLKTVLHLSGRCWCMQILMVCMFLKDSDYPAGLKSTENWSNRIAIAHIPVIPTDNLACFLPDFLQSWNHTLYTIWILVFSNIT